MHHKVNGKWFVYIVSSLNWKSTLNWAYNERWKYSILYVRNVQPQWCCKIVNRMQVVRSEIQNVGECWENRQNYYINEEMFFTFLFISQKYTLVVVVERITRRTTRTKSNAHDKMTKQQKHSRTRSINVNILQLLLSTASFRFLEIILWWVKTKNMCTKLFSFCTLYMFPFSSNGSYLASVEHLYIL